MKHILHKITAFSFAGIALLTTTISPAQVPIDTASTTTTTTSAGTVSTFSPDGIVVRTTTSADPVSYSYSKTTTYVDENGNPVSSETIKSGAPVTVYYDRDGSRMIATKVMVRKSVVADSGTPLIKETSTTTSAGTVSQFSPDTIMVQTTGATAPVSYSYSKTTSYVDENGNTVSSESVKSGAPVTVYYTQDGDKMVATKVIVRKSTTTTTPNP